MEQNNFEKNVQQKMDDLKIAPSDSVWTYIEKRIGKKHKDRKVIFIFFFLILLLSAGGYWLFNSTKNNAPQNQQIGQLKKDSKRINNEDSYFEKSKLTKEDNLKNADTTIVLREKANKFKISSVKEIAKKNGKKKEKLIDDSSSQTKDDYSKRTNNEDSLFILYNTNKSFKINPAFPEIDIANHIDDIKNMIQNKITMEDLLNQLAAEKNIQELISKNDSLAKKTSTNKNKNPWIFGITFSGGASLISSNLLEKNYSMADAVSGGSPGSNLPQPYYYTASPIKNSTAFAAGVSLEKNISAKSKISLGITYKYYSLTNTVGNRVGSTTAPSQYLATNSFNNSANLSRIYRNNFHFLELPVSVRFQINNNNKLPLFWNGGINISQLISSNALQFQSNPGIYFNDNSMFNKTQFALHTGLSLTFFSQQKMPLTFGPYFYYSATSLSSKGLYDGKHFSFAGIKVEIQFRKK